VLTLDADHLALLTQPDRIADAVLRASGLLSGETG